MLVVMGLFCECNFFGISDGVEQIDQCLRRKCESLLDDGKIPLNRVGIIEAENIRSHFLNGKKNAYHVNYSLGDIATTYQVCQVDVSEHFKLGDHFLFQEGADL